MARSTVALAVDRQQNHRASIAGTRWAAPEAPHRPERPRPSAAPSRRPPGVWHIPLISDGDPDAGIDVAEHRGDVSDHVAIVPDQAPPILFIGDEAVAMGIPGLISACGARIRAKLAAESSRSTRTGSPVQEHPQVDCQVGRRGRGDSRRRCSSRARSPELARVPVARDGRRRTARSRPRAAVASRG